MMIKPKKIAHAAESENERAIFYNISSVPPHNKLRYEVFGNYCKNKKVADFSCGCGYGSYILSGVSKAVHGFDYSEKAIDFCKTYWSNDNVKYDVMDINNIATDETFDVIVHSETIEHIKATINQTLKNLSELLRPNGIFCITHPENEPKEKAAGGHVHFNIKRCEMEVLLRNIGFKIIQSKEYAKGASMIVAQKGGV